MDEPTAVETQARANGPTVLLGPQNDSPNLAAALGDAGWDGPLAVVTAGWEEREDEDYELAEHVGVPLHNLRLFGRAGELLQSDSEFASTWYEHRDRRRAARHYYDVRLGHALDAVRELMAEEANGESEHERALTLALDQVRTLDSEHLERTAALNRDLREQLPDGPGSLLERQRGEIVELVERCSVLCIAGGHVQVLLDHLRLYGVMEVHGSRPVMAWSAGAMVLGSRVVLFHDRPPWGRGNAEMFDSGFARVPDVLLPHARERLHLDDESRVQLLARRLHPLCARTLDEGSRIQYGLHAKVRADAVGRLTIDGAVCDLDTPVFAAPAGDPAAADPEARG